MGIILGMKFDTLELTVGNAEFWNEAKLKRDWSGSSETSGVLQQVRGNSVVEDVLVVSFAMSVAILFCWFEVVMFKYPEINDFSLLSCFSFVRPSVRREILDTAHIICEEYGPLNFVN